MSLEKKNLEHVRSEQGADYTRARTAVLLIEIPLANVKSRTLEMLYHCPHKHYQPKKISGGINSEVNKRGRPSKWPPECLPSKFADFECAFSQ